MVSLVEQGSGVGSAQYGLGPSEHGAHGPLVVDVGHLVVDGQVVLPVHGALHVIGHFGHHTSDDQVAAFGVGGRYLLLTRFFQLLLQVFIPFPAPFVPVDLIVDLLLFAVAIGLGKGCIVLFEFAVYVFDVPLYLLVVVVVLLAVLGAQLGTIACNYLSTYEAVGLGQLHRGAEHALDGNGIVLSEVGDGVVVGRKAVEQPHQLQVAAALTLQHARGADAVHVAVDEQLDQHAGVVGGPSVLREMHLEPHFSQIEAIDKGIDAAHLIVLFYTDIERGGEKRGLPAIGPFYESHIMKVVTICLRMTGNARNDQQVIVGFETV